MKEHILEIAREADNFEAQYMKKSNTKYEWRADGRIQKTLNELKGGLRK